VEDIGSLSGISVVERSGRLAGGICAKLLADLGANVTRYAAPSDEPQEETAAWSEHPYVLGRKKHAGQSTDQDGETASWEELVQGADVVILTSTPSDDGRSETDEIIHSLNHEDKIICVLSAFGYAEKQPPVTQPNETEFQAICGLMATTGSVGGPPSSIDAPVLEIFAGINAATSIIGAHRILESGGRCQILDIAVFDSAFALLGTFFGDVTSGKSRGFRGGCLHPMLAPWNAYRASDGWAILCSSSNAHWANILKLIGRDEYLSDSRFSDARTRRMHVEDVDGLIQEWIGKQTTADVVRKLEENAVPISSIVSVDEFSERESFLPCRRTSVGTNIPSSVQETGSGTVREFPLSGIRVIEVGPYTAGPLAGRLLANLGAEVIKVEPPGGEISRFWEPQRNGVGVYFANYNAGKRSITLDLTSADGERIFTALIRSAHVLIHNLKAGSMDKMGYGAEQLLKEQPGLVYCAISGYGREGPATPALDMVIQAKAGLMSLVDSGDVPMKAGFSVADLISAHIAPMEISAAIRRAQRTGEGQVLDISMYDSVAWLTRLGWPDVDHRLPETTVLETRDGWVLANGKKADLPSSLSLETITSMTTEKLMEQMSILGIRAVKILELDEVLSLDIVRRRQLLRTIKCSSGIETELIAAPYRFSSVPLPHSGEVPEANADGDALVPSG
jgi:crotonobetainyl-CoA:carnitine CoA-transferase CaiB-like acyl-CoA transferase